MKKSLLVVALGSVFALSSAQAASVTLSGSFFDVTYDDALTGLFGTPTLVDNTLSWTPSGSPGFSAASYGEGIKVTNSTFAVTVTAKDNYLINGASLWESGDYFYFGDGSGVSATGQLRGRGMDMAGSPIATTSIVAGSFTPNALFDFSTTDWTATALVTLDESSKSATFIIQNILAAYNPPNSFPTAAFIEKKNIDLAISVVPEADTYLMMLAGLGMIGLMAKRRMS
ncbi:PEP-CTERM sorting domain-containing protein [Methyloversatilis sp.]|uniref:PEP-CTERM sorting domain-containing protein n=1 Tax=Methyloversatilis sp. TaxID=2569862 RepID=UPI002736ADB3|nr:PEP-CTERM sorting domain-containing protein [Methyloversatilis sp.]MDP2870703.1 PEP-CTERM sorting domain-containing protein [Methyloversatilis sp.]MDP3288670.1 PEP-CTERM sorting domain-containing protein [Methyloversatilis sp.]MDP3455655.1 PEP-CTERM sorting domain-containing protein [Methyloversatilis sp.]MDP3577516.1 PEP-CTERM sorting domain-containing protein [Methyloversatilis sp.]